MRRLPDAGPNAEQIRYWNDDAGPKWVTFADDLDGVIGPLGRLAMERAAVAPGERVLDVGCGCGHSTLMLGERAGARGRVTGIDISSEMLATAARRARDAGAANLDFELADAQTAALPGAPFDLVYSRFGVMFFADPVAAFSNLRRALAPDGRLAFVCWQEIGKNPWMLEPLRAAGKHVALPAPPEPGAPGPFSLGDPERVRAVLDGAGFGGVRVEGVQTQLTLSAEGVDEATRFLLEGVGPTSRLLHEAGEEVRAAAAESVREVVAAHLTADGVRMDCAVWIVTGR
jgi:SAM-dependent methyltransferase